MKTFTFLSFLVVVYLQVDGRSLVHQSNELPKVLKDTMRLTYSCTNELGPSKLSNLPTDFGGLSQYPEDNAAVNALWGCIFNKMGIVDDDSHINKNKLQEYFTGVADIVGKTSATDLQEIENLTRECSKVKGTDSGQTAVKIQNCAVRYFVKS